VEEEPLEAKITVEEDEDVECGNWKAEYGCGRCDGIGGEEDEDEAEADGSAGF
jgi:hypothetical protein